MVVEVRGKDGSLNAESTRVISSWAVSRYPRFFQVLTTMASKSPSAGQQGITKNLSGANAAFNDKVCVYPAHLTALPDSLSDRESPWNFGYRIWLLQKVFLPLELNCVHFLNAYTAISDAVRTSLGPRGMDKMVRRTAISAWLAVTFI